MGSRTTAVMELFVPTVLGADNLERLPLFLSQFGFHGNWSGSVLTLLR